MLHNIFVFTLAACSFSCLTAMLLNRTHFSQFEALGETASTWQVAPNRHQAEAKAANEIPKPEEKEATEAESPEAEA